MTTFKAKAVPRRSSRELGKAYARAKQAGGPALDTTSDLEIDPMHFLPDRKDWPYWFHYEGSLTSGFFSEDVSWFVFRNETALAKVDIEKLKGAAEQDARETFALNRRFVLRSFE
jgi:carbonic anhydrase